MTQINDRDFSHRFAFGFMGDALKDLAFTVRNQISGARAVSFKFSQSLADIFRAFFELCFRNREHLFAFHNR